MVWLGGMHGRRLGRVVGCDRGAGLGYGELGLLRARSSGERRIWGMGSGVCSANDDRRKLVPQGRVCLASRRVNSRSEGREGHRPCRLAYLARGQVVPVLLGALSDSAVMRA